MVIIIVIMLVASMRDRFSYKLVINKRVINKLVINKLASIIIILVNIKVKGHKSIEVVRLVIKHINIKFIGLVVTIK